MKYYAVVNNIGEYRVNAYSENYNELVTIASEQAYDYLLVESELSEKEINKLSDKKLIQELNWEIIEVSKDIYNYIKSYSTKDIYSNWITISKNRI